MNAMERDCPAIVVDNLSFKPDTKGPKLLHNISFVLQPGKLTGVLGASGSGKTTLLNVLLNRFDKGAVVDGKIFWAPCLTELASRVQPVILSLQSTTSQPVPESIQEGASRFATSSKIAFVAANEVLSAGLTIRESVRFAARLRLPKLSAEELENRVTHVLRDTNLSKFEDKKVPLTGGAASGILGVAEFKRLSLAAALVDDPEVIILDEPTTGLDPFECTGNMDLLRAVATMRPDGTCRTVLCTIHQPRNAIFNMFDHIILLHDGRLLYSGPPRDIVDYFQKSLNIKCPSLWSPADFALEVASQSSSADAQLSNVKEFAGSEKIATTKVVKSLAEIEDVSKLEYFRNDPFKVSFTALELAEKYQSSALAKQQRDFISTVEPSAYEAKLQRPRPAASWLSQFFTLFRRQFVVQLRKPGALLLMLAIAVVQGLVMGFIFGDLPQHVRNLEPIDVSDTIRDVVPWDNDFLRTLLDGVDGNGRQPLFEIFDAGASGRGRSIVDTLLTNSSVLNWGRDVIVKSYNLLVNPTDYPSLDWDPVQNNRRSSFQTKEPVSLSEIKSVAWRAVPSHSKNFPVEIKREQSLADKQMVDLSGQLIARLKLLFSAGLRQLSALELEAAQKVAQKHSDAEEMQLSWSPFLTRAASVPNFSTLFSTSTSDQTPFIESKADLLHLMADTFRLLHSIDHVWYTTMWNTLEMCYGYRDSVQHYVCLALKLKPLITVAVEALDFPPFDDMLRGLAIVGGVEEWLETGVPVPPLPSEAPMNHPIISPTVTPDGYQLFNKQSVEFTAPISQSGFENTAAWKLFVTGTKEDLFNVFHQYGFDNWIAMNLGWDVADIFAAIMDYGQRLANCTHAVCELASSTAEVLVRTAADFLNSAYITVSTMFNLCGVLFFIALFIGFSAYDALLTFPRDRRQFNVETANGLYSESAYFLAKTTADFPFQLLPCLSLGLIFYYCCGLHHLAPETPQIRTVCIYLLVCVLASSAAYGFGYAISASFAKFSTAVLVAPIILMFWLVVAGFFLRESDVPAWIAWTKYTSFYRHSYFALVATFFPKGSFFGSLPNEFAYALGGVGTESIAFSCGMLVMVNLLYRFCGFIALKYLHRNVGLMS